ncbi:DUF4873 domain-containing protein [Saccharomonospora viridis]|uniref:DUF4873 domain-containing protein n=2 Tax=Saccharomonospora viridis TaxID=1852 RepID=C7MVM0_SACVD|nr:DUF4873 domain-containing protein [Saccharomonospora viridis]ACU95739.1 hypothetical protein Svir_06680 [Saccharomonospora viridis DSM 43017]KHF43953.1 monooxygenase [Saccharomonospora viridis]SFP89192.1 protein of unknown function [Saccharomonospora viridis]
MSGHEHDEDGYTGAATLVLGETELDIEVELRGHFQPIDGYYRWYGRIKANPTLSELAGGKKHKVEIRTPEGSAHGEISDPDPWDRYRIMGKSTPPFAVPTSLEDLAPAES